MKHFTNQIILGVFGVLLLIALSLVEAAAGFKWNYHRDAQTYIEAYHDWPSIFNENPLFLVNNAFYLYVDLLGKNIYTIIFINYVAFIITNYFIYRASKLWLKRKRYHLIVLMIFLFNPYRLHLANFVLKDTLIILFVCISFYKAIFEKASYLAMSASFILRYASVIYFTALFKFTSKYIVIFVIFLLIILTLSSRSLIEFVETIMSISEGDMRIRAFDRTPTFSEFGIYGGLIRAIVWPFLLVTGIFVVFSQSLPVIMVAISSLTSTIYWSYMGGFTNYIYKVFVPLSLLAFIVPGFVAYQRYAFPIILFGGFIMLRRKS